MNVEIPEGYMADSQGRLIPLEQVKEIDFARDALVKELAGRLLEMRDQVREVKQGCMGDVAAFIDMSLENWGVKPGGNKGNITLSSYDGRYKLKVAVQECLEFDEQLQAAKALIDQCLTDWSEGARPEIKTLIQDAFRVNQEGKVDTRRILALRKLEISDERWQRAMKAIGESITVVSSKEQLRVYERQQDGSYSQIVLDFSRI